MLQAVRFGRIGTGQVLVMGSSGAFIGVSIVAIAQGGPALLATLVVCSALFRRLLTPAVSGTVIMLVPVTVVPIVFGMLEDVPDGSPTRAAPLAALATTVAIVATSLKGPPALRLWSPIIGVVAGAAVAGFALSALPEIHEFLRDFAARSGATGHHLDAVAEETLLALLRPGEDGRAQGTPRRLRLSASRVGGGATLEFVVAPSGENIE